MCWAEPLQWWAGGGAGQEAAGRMAQHMPPPVQSPFREEDSDSDASEDSAGEKSYIADTGVVVGFYGPNQHWPIAQMCWLTVSV